MSITSATNDYYKINGYGTFGYPQSNDPNGSSSTAAALKRAQALLGSNATPDTLLPNGYSDLANTVSEALKGMGLDASDPVTFNTILQYRNKLSAAFEKGIKDDLKKLGVDENIKFQLTADEQNGLNVVCADKESKLKIEKYFKDNPDRVKEFQNIQALSNVESARKAQGIDPAAVRQRIQIESMTAWFANTGQSTASIMNFSGGEMSLYSGLNKKI